MHWGWWSHQDGVAFWRNTWQGGGHTGDPAAHAGWGLGCVHVLVYIIRAPTHTKQPKQYLATHAQLSSPTPWRS